MNQTAIGIVGALLTLMPLAHTPVEAKTIEDFTRRGFCAELPTPGAAALLKAVDADGARRPPIQMAQRISPYPGYGGYYYPPGYDPRQPTADGWGWTGRGWGNTFSGGWNAGSNSGYGGRNFPPPHRGNRW